MGIRLNSNRTLATARASFAGVPVASAVLFLEPFDWRNRRAFGHDMFSGSKRRAALIGYIFSPFRMDYLMRPRVDDDISLLVLKIYSGEETAAASLMYDSRVADPSIDRVTQPPFMHTAKVAFDDCAWTVVLSSTTAEDNGIGFNIKQLGRIFAPFQRLHGRDAYEGAGMELPICKKMVLRHGGAIPAESEPGKGTAFIFTLAAVETATRTQSRLGVATESRQVTV